MNVRVIQLYTTRSLFIKKMIKIKLARATFHTLYIITDQRQEYACEPDAQRALDRWNDDHPEYQIMSSDIQQIAEKTNTKADP